IPQFCPAPTNILVRLLKPATWTGLGLLFVVPSPSCPHSLSPQQKMGGLTLPPTSAQACWLPAPISRTLPRAMVTGVAERPLGGTVGPSTWNGPAFPQQTRVPSLLRAQAKKEIGRAHV